MPLTRVSRRNCLKGIAAAVGGTTWPWPRQAAASGLVQSATTPRHADVTGRLARYMVSARTATLPPDTVREAKHRILDTVAAMISGARLLPGEKAIAYARLIGGTPEATVLTTNVRTTAVNAALVNAMLAHADETDDVDPVTKAHPGSVAVPVALAMAEREGRSGMDVIRAVTLGYDLGCRVLNALGADHVRATHRSAEGTSATFTALGAAGALAPFDEREMRFAISYAAQQMSGLWSWVSDEDHVEKAFDFAGMGARNGVTAVTMVQAGFTGVADVLDGPHNMLQALSANPHPEEMVTTLGTRFFVTETAIKPYSVGYPIQAAVDSFLALKKDHAFTTSTVQKIVVSLPEDGARIVDNSAMPDVNLQYIIAVALIDGAVTFANSHARERMSDGQVQAVQRRIQLVADRGLMNPDAPRSARVEVTLTTGESFRHFTPHASGSKENPLNTAQVAAKARDLMLPVIGARRTETLIDQIDRLETLTNVRELRSLLGA